MQDDLNPMKADLQFKELLNKMARYCAYQERSSGDVLNKLRRYEVSSESEVRIMDALTNEGFIDDNRYSQSYVNGKLANNNWGKIKIRMGLKERGISERIIDESLAQIEESKYRAIIQKLISAKSKHIENEIFIKKNKIARFLLSKGFESHVIWEELETFNF